MRHQKFKVILILSILCLSLCDVFITHPSQLKDKFGLESNIPHRWGNFGEIPYGRTISGRIYWGDNITDNSWCNINNLPQYTFKTSLVLDTTPIILVDAGGDCSFSQKAYNVEARGGKAMLLVSNDQTFKNFLNYDDQFGKVENVPSIIIRKSDGDIIKDYIRMKRDMTESINMLIQFNSLSIGKIVNLDLYLRSDDVKSLGLFKELAPFFLDPQVSKFINIEPIYKYTRCQFCKPNVEYDFCAFEGQYCGAINPSLQIDNQRLVFVENIRQKCIYQIYKEKKNLKSYFDYMSKFLDNCANIHKPNFTEECANQIIYELSIDNYEVVKCYNDSIKDKSSSSLVKDTDRFSMNRVWSYPAFYINKIKFKGSWYNKFIKDAICSAFEDQIKINACSPDYKPSYASTNNSSTITFGFVVLIIFIISIITFFIVWCYKRFVHRSLDTTIDEKIQTQTIFSLGQYQIFKDSEASVRTVDETKL